MTLPETMDQPTLETMESNVEAKNLKEMLVKDDGKDKTEEHRL